jgi:ketosteroid isomerase-like protein
MAGLVLLSACQMTETAEKMTARMASESATARTEVEAINVRYAQFLNANQADSVAALFMEDGILMPPNAPAVVGRAAIRDYLAGNPMPAGSNIAFTVTDVDANGSMMVERGTTLFTMPAAGKTPAVNMPGKYLVHWQKVNGTWLQVATIWSDDAPMPAMPPMPATPTKK